MWKKWREFWRKRTANELFRGIIIINVLIIFISIVITKKILIGVIGYITAVLIINFVYIIFLKKEKEKREKIIREAREEREKIIREEKEKREKIIREVREEIEKMLKKNE